MATIGVLAILLLSSSSGFCQMMTGGWTNVRSTDKNVQALAMASESEMNSRSNSIYRHKMVNLVKAEVQVVAGLKYRLVMDLGETDCRKDDDTTLLEDCNVNTQHMQTCTAVYWLQPWLKTQTVEDFHCEAHVPDSTTTTTPPLLGGEMDLDPDDDEVSEAAQFAVDEMNRASNSLRLLVLRDVKKVTKQTVAGTKWKLMLEIGESSCFKNHPKNNAKDTCASKVNKVSLCNVEVLEQKWNTPRFELLSHKCADDSATNAPKTTIQDDRRSNNVLQMRQNEVHPPNLGVDDHDVGNYGSFLEFKQTYNKVYADKKEETRRFNIFRKNMLRARKLQDTEKGTARYGVTKFADLTEEEFKKYITPEWDLTADDDMDQAQIPDAAGVPDSWDWREHNAVTPVKNQGQCGSCWAFSTTGNIEGQWALKKGHLLSLSEQELVDCDKIDQGCNGGLPTNAYKAIERLGGLETEAEYPYEGEGEKCAYKRKEAAAYINNSVAISTDENDMKVWLQKNGPISIGINANAMQYYMGGVSHPWSIFCNPESLDHGVLIVGYGTKSGWFGETPYWIVKNSWGADWGEKGYYLVYRGGGVCGLNKMPTSAVVN